MSVCCSMCPMENLFASHHLGLRLAVVYLCVHVSRAVEGIRYYCSSQKNDKGLVSLEVSAVAFGANALLVQPNHLAWKVWVNHLLFGMPTLWIGDLGHQGGQVRWVYRPLHLGTFFFFFPPPCLNNPCKCAWWVRLISFGLSKGSITNRFIVFSVKTWHHNEMLVLLMQFLAVGDLSFQYEALCPALEAVKFGEFCTDAAKANSKL